MQYHVEKQISRWFLHRFAMKTSRMNTPPYSADHVLNIPKFGSIEGGDIINFTLLIHKKE